MAKTAIEDIKILIAYIIDYEIILSTLNENSIMYKIYEKRFDEINTQLLEAIQEYGGK